MKQSNILLYILFFFSLSIQLSSQDLTILWDKTFNDDKYSKEVINEWLLLPDGNLVGVGFRQVNKIKSGLLVKVNTKTGQQLFHKIYSEPFKDMVFKSIAEAHDGSLYLVGFVQIHKILTQGIIVRTDELGNKLWEKRIGKKRTSSTFAANSNSFERIVWREDNKGFIVGYDKSMYNHKHNSHLLTNGTICRLIIKQDSIISNMTTKGPIWDITGLSANLDNTVWLVGNAKKSDISDKADIYISKFDAIGTEIDTKIVGGSDAQRVINTASNYKGELSIVGMTTKGTLGDKDAWLLELDSNGNITLDKSFSEPREEQAIAVAESFDRNRWVLLETRPSNKKKKIFGHHIAVLGNELITNYKLKAKDIHLFQAQDLIRTYQGDFIVTVTMAGSHGSYRLLSLKKYNYLTSKSFSQIKATAPKRFFEDRNKDGCFSENERGYLEFSLKNIGDTPIFEGQITLNPQITVRGLKFGRTKQFIPYLPIGKERKIRIYVLAEHNLQSGDSQGSIEVISKGRLLTKLPYNFNSINCDIPSTKSDIINFGWIKPNIVSLNSREARTVEDFFSLELSISSPKIIKQSDPKIYKNGILLKDEKAGERNLSNPMKEGFNFNYRFTYTIRQLKKGKNTVYIQLDEQQTDSIIIYYEPHKPNLHVLAIGPKYKDLKYTTKDARDFALAIAQQEGNGFFANVILDTLLTEQKTTATQIKVAFSKLKNRYKEEDRPDKIYPNDYLIIFVSSHGIKHEGKFRLLPSDYDEAAILETTVDYKEDVIGYLNQIDCKKILFIDACLSGNVGSKAPTYQNISSALLRANESATGTVSFASCSEKELSYEDAKWENGVFTEALLEALNGQKVRLSSGDLLGLEEGVDTADEIITIEELFQFLSVRVPDLMKSLNNGLSQTPTISNNHLEKKLPIFLLK